MSVKKKILIADDDEDILEFTKYNLEKEGYIVFTAINGRLALKEAIREIPDLIILDVMMPEMDGVEACVELRKVPELKNTIITFLSARNEDYSQIAGLDAGADDYITKPIKPRLLVSRVNALLRRNASPLEDSSPVDWNRNVRIDREKYKVFKGDMELELPRKEFELLALLLSNPEKVFERNDIMEKVWGMEVVVGDRTIDVHIRKLREKLGGEYIKTIKGVGYKFDVN